MLIKAEVGRTRKPSFNLPPESFSYGTNKYKTLDGDVYVKKPKVTRVSETSPPKTYQEMENYTDFTRINKYGAWKGMNTKVSLFVLSLNFFLLVTHFYQK